MSSLAGFGIGWGKPVQVNPYNFRITPRAGMGIVAIAGPISNLILAALGGLVYQLVAPPPGLLAQFLVSWVYINVALFLFNLIPVFPLDGYKIFIAILDALGQSWSLQLAKFWERQVQYGPLILMLLLVINRQLPQFSPISWLFGDPFNTLVGVFL